MSYTPAPMTPADRPEPTRRSRILLTTAVAAGGLLLDLATKQWAWNNLRVGQPVTVIPDWFYLEFGFNTGSAFSLLRDASWARYFFIVVTLAAVAYMVHLARTLPTRWASAFVAVGLIASGALGNLHDRLFRTLDLIEGTRHGVVDFLKFYYWPGKAWPTFNVADVALVIGVAMILVFLSRHGDALEAPAGDDAAPEPTPGAAPQG